MGGATLVLSWGYVCLLYLVNNGPVQAKEQRKWFNRRCLMNLTSLGELKDMWAWELKPFLIPRESGTEGNKRVQQHIESSLKVLGWTVKRDKFNSVTPLGERTFTNIIATYNPRASRRFILACHFDSKRFDFVFVAATDSAVPCALLLALAREFKELLKKGNGSVASDITLELVFFDGEEAFETWTEKDSIYGARHLAKKWEKTTSKTDRKTNMLESISHFVLLDLIGSPNMKFHNFFPYLTNDLFETLMKIEETLAREELIYREYDGSYQPMFSSGYQQGGIEDDHIPFLRKGVKVLHLITYPFPSVWHKETDTEENLDQQKIANFKNIFTVFVAYYLQLFP